MLIVYAIPFFRQQTFFFSFSFQPRLFPGRGFLRAKKRTHPRLALLRRSLGSTPKDVTYVLYILIFFLKSLDALEVYLRIYAITVGKGAYFA